MTVWLSLNINVFEGHTLHPFSGRKKSFSNIVTWYELSVGNEALDIIWRHVEQLLRNDCEISNYTTAVTRQRTVNSNRGIVFSVQSVPRCYKDKLGVAVKGRVIAQAVVAGFPPRRPGSGHVGFVVDKVALGQVFSGYFGFPC
jgi:hypothetical protein